MTTFSLFGMRQDSVQKLFDTFPALFRFYRHFIEALESDGGESPIRCGQGRFELVFELSRNIESVARQMGLDHRTEQWPMVVRIDDVDGMLEFNVLTPQTDGISLFPLYLAGAARPLVTRGFRRIIAEAELKSAQTCDSCGEPGRFRNGHTQCDWCSEERLRVQNEDDELREP